MFTTILSIGQFVIKKKLYRNVHSRSSYPDADKVLEEDMSMELYGVTAWQATIVVRKPDYRTTMESVALTENVDK